jgi:hypothetical protein
MISNRPLTQAFWRAVDCLEYWIMQARLWTVDVTCGPLPDRDRPD